MANSRNSNRNSNTNSNRGQSRDVAKGKNEGRGRKEEPRNESKMLICYHINERGDRSYWTRIGVAFQNRDGSLNVKLETIPVNGELHIREYVAREDADSDDGEDYGDAYEGDIT